MNVDTRMLVKSEQISIDGVAYMRLYFYDTMDGIVLMYDAPIYKSRGIPLLDKTKEVQEEPEMEPVQEQEIEPEIAPILELLEDEEEEKKYDL